MMELVKAYANRSKMRRKRFLLYNTLNIDARRNRGCFIMITN